MTSKLLDRKTLMELHPALNNKWRLDYLIRTRKIPIVKIGKQIFFNENEIYDWIKENSISPNKY